MPRTNPRDELGSIRHDAASPGDKKIVKELREAGSKTARERIIGLLDESSLVEIDAFVKHRSGDYGMHVHTPLGDGVVAGHG